MSAAGSRHLPEIEHWLRLHHRDGRRQQNLESGLHQAETYAYLLSQYALVRAESRNLRKIILPTCEVFAFCDVNVLPACAI